MTPVTRLYTHFLPDYQSGKFPCHHRVCIHTPVCTHCLRCCFFNGFQNQRFGASIPFAQGRVSTCSFRCFGVTHLPPPTAISISLGTSCFPHAFPGSHCTRPPCLCNRCVCIPPDAPPPTDQPPLEIDLGTMWLHCWLPRLFAQYLENVGNNWCEHHGRVALLVWLCTRPPARMVAPSRCCPYYCPGPCSYFSQQSLVRINCRYRGL